MGLRLVGRASPAARLVGTLGGTSGCTSLSPSLRVAMSPNIRDAANSVMGVVGGLAGTQGGGSRGEERAGFTGSQEAVEKEREEETSSGGTAWLSGHGNPSANLGHIRAFYGSA